MAEQRSSSDSGRLQEIHDAAVAAGAVCGHAVHKRETGILVKANPDWDAQPRIPSGARGGGQWTNGATGAAPEIGGDERSDVGRDRDGVIDLVATGADSTGATKERFVDRYLAGAQRAADALEVPVENILGAAAVESSWGRSRFALEAHNFFALHYPAAFAEGYVLSRVGGRKLARFASYDDSVRSFVAHIAPFARGMRDPEAFATALQDHGKFGIDPDRNTKVAKYVSGLAATIRGLRALLKARQI